MAKKASRERGWVLGLIGQILAFITFIFLALMLVHSGIVGFFPDAAMSILTTVMFALIVVTIGFNGLAFSLGKSWILFIIFVIIFAAVMVFIFLPGALPEWLPRVSNG